METKAGWQTDMVVRIYCRQLLGSGQADLLGLCCEHLLVVLALVIVLLTLPLAHTRRHWLLEERMGDEYQTSEICVCKRKTWQLKCRIEDTHTYKSFVIVIPARVQAVSPATFAWPDLTRRNNEKSVRYCVDNFKMQRGVPSWHNMVSLSIRRVQARDYLSTQQAHAQRSLT